MPGSRVGVLRAAQHPPIGVGWLAVPEEIAVLANGAPSANSVARCLSIETMTCSSPGGIGGVLSFLLSFRLDLPSAGLGRGLNVRLGGGSNGSTIL